MGALGIVFTIVIMLIAILLVLVVLAQNSKGGGISSSVGLSNQVMGVQRSTENVEKITWGLLIALGVFCVASGLVFNQKSVQSGPKNTGYVPLKTQYDMPNNPVQDPSSTMTTMPNGSTGTQQPK